MFARYHMTGSYIYVNIYISLLVIFNISRGIILVCERSNPTGEMIKNPLWAGKRVFQEITACYQAPLDIFNFSTVFDRFHL